MKKFIIIGLCIALISVVTFFLHNVSPNSNTLHFDKKAVLNGTTIDLAKAVTSQEWETGLSGQKKLGDNQGLLFVFDHVGTYGIWMKDMLFPVDVLWLDENYSVTTKKENFLPSSYPEVVYPNESVSFVLELPAGFISTHNINIGDRLSL